MPSYQLYYDALHEAEWLQAHHELLAAAKLLPIRTRGENPARIDALISYDRPDAIVCKDQLPILTVEKTKEVPTGHNVGQRMARLVRSLECGVPVIYKMPFDARKHGSFTNPCFLNIRLLDAFMRMSRLHRVPIVAVNTEIDDQHEIVTEDGDEAVQQILRDYLESLDFGAFDAASDNMRREYARRLKRRAAYGKPPASVSVVSSRSYLGHLPFQVSQAREFLARPETVVYTILMTPEKCRREDPYTGMAFIYDYTMCRSGPEPADKTRNLVLSIPQVSKARWLEANPADPTRKSSNWYLTATIVALGDGYVYANDGRLLGR